MDAEHINAVPSVTLHTFIMAFQPANVAHRLNNIENILGTLSEGLESGLKRIADIVETNKKGTNSFNHNYFQVYELNVHTLLLSLLYPPLLLSIPLPHCHSTFPLPRSSSRFKRVMIQTWSCLILIKQNK